MSKSITSTFNKKDILFVVALLGFLCLFVGFLYSRVVSNVGILLIGIYTVSQLKDIKWLWHDKWMWTWVAMVALPIASDVIYEGIDFLSQRGTMKLVLLLFPAFFFVLNPDRKKTRWFHYLVISAVTYSSAYGLYHYFDNLDQMASTYKVSKVSNVLSYSDHIRISWFSVIGMIIATYEFKKSSNKTQKTFLALFILLQIVFLHLLGSKTGLLMLYLATAIGIFYTLRTRFSWRMVAIIPIIALLPYVAYQTIPSFNQRVNYIIYDYEYYSKGEYAPGLSDAVRFYSIKGGFEIIKQNPITGVGFSRLQSHINTWYKTNLPTMPRESYFLPSSQYLIYFASGGILGLLVIVSHTLLPFFISYLRRNVWFMLFYLPAIVSFTFETHLEGQLPLFIYGFFLAWFWSLAYKEKDSVKIN